MKLFLLSALFFALLLTPSLCLAQEPHEANEPDSEGRCGVYADSKIEEVAGNKGEVFKVVKVAREHLNLPNDYDKSTTEADNTIKTDTACSFSKMYDAAEKEGVHFKIDSAFRPLARQEYFWHCYQTKTCNGGHLAAVPGNSNHGLGVATDINVSANPNTYKWLSEHAHEFGFVRAVPTEKWHWEHHPGYPRAPYT